MKTALLALVGVGMALSALPADALDKTRILVCDKWRDGVCVSTESVKVKGAPPAFAVGHVFGPTYSYVPVTDLPQPVVTYHKLTPDHRYVYSDGYIYVVDPATYAVTRVLDIVN
jgi:hypothetical protein